MLRIRTVGLALMVVLTFSAVAASAASATTPEWTSPEWKGPYPKPFTLESAAHSEVAFKFSLGTTTCKRVIGQGEITEKKHAKVKLSFIECPLMGEPVTFPLEMLMGFINKETSPPEVGVEFKAEAGNKQPLMEFPDFYGTKQPLVIKGGIIGSLTPVNTLTSKFELKFTESGGKQAPQKLEGKETTTKLEDFFESESRGEFVMVTRDTLLTLTEGETEIEL